MASDLYLGTVRQVALFHGEAMKMGMAIVGGGPPATPLWQVLHDPSQPATMLTVAQGMPSPNLRFCNHFVARYL